MRTKPTHFAVARVLIGIAAVFSSVGPAVAAEFDLRPHHDETIPLANPQVSHSHRATPARAGSADAFSEVAGHRLVVEQSGCQRTSYSRNMLGGGNGGGRGRSRFDGSVSQRSR